MVATPYVKSSSLTTEDIFEREVAAQLTILGSNVLTAINSYSDVPDVVPGVVINGVQPTFTDAGTGFPAFTSGAGSSAGVVVYCQDAMANGVINISVPTVSLQSLTMSSGIIDLYGAVLGLYNTGVTVSNNLAFRLTCVGLNLGAAVSTTQCWLQINYKYKNV